MPLPTLETPRLLLRPPDAEDFEAMVAMHAHPQVMEFLPAMDRRATAQMMERLSAHFATHGFGLWAVEVKGGARFVGLAGLLVPRFEAHFTPCVEVGWRLAHEHWGHGYATEAARRALDYGFSDKAFSQIVSLTVPRNVRSRSVMERLGMRRRPEDDFDHPWVEEGNPLRRHVLYRIDAPSPRA